MTVSFRTRLFVIAAIVVSLALSAVLLVGWIRVLAYEVERLDERLCIEARRVATQPIKDESMARLEVDLLGKLRLSQAAQLMVKFESGASGPPLNSPMSNAQSANWRNALVLDGAHWKPALLNALTLDDLIARPPPSLPQLGSAEPPRPTGPPGPSRPPAQPEPPEIRAPDGAPQKGTCALTTFEAEDQQWRAARVTAGEARGVIAVDLAATKSELQGAFKQALKIVAPLALVLTALGAWSLSSLTMRPVNRMRGAMLGVTQTALNTRLPTQGEDREFVVLIDAYNTMLARLEKSFQQASRFSSDAAHELKTPLTILQGRIEQALSRSSSPALQADLVGLQDEVGRLAAITRKLLLLSQADAGVLTLQRTAIDLTRLLDELASDAQMLLTSQTLQCAIDRRLFVQGDKVLLQQLMNNLISNSVRYCSPGGRIKISACTVPGGIEVVVANSSQRIGPAERARFFDRFYRGEASRNRSIEGSGLGLSLSREIARAHGGDLVLKASAPDVVKLQLTL